MLRRIGVTPVVAPAQPSPSQHLTGDYERFLLEERNLSRQSVRPLGRFADRFLSEMFGAGELNLAKLRAPDVTGFVQRHAHDHGSPYAKWLVRALRSFLRYLHYKGLVDTDLSIAVPKVAHWALSTLPKHLQRCKCGKCCDTVTAARHGDDAITPSCFCSHGLVCAVDNTRITVCGKNGSWAQLPLPADVARAIAHYLRHDRPHCACRRVFIRDYAPLGGFEGSQSISKIVQCALAKAGVESSRKGAHLLRHSLATDMLRKGASLDEIGEVLRHKSPDSTAIYAKVDLGSLQALALPWPGGAR
jgi:site-specific recombinase XerD